MTQPIELRFDREFFSADAIQRAVYRLSDRLSCDLRNEQCAYVCVVHPLAADADIHALAAELRNEALDYTLRERIRDETRDVRNVILALAFTDTKLVDIQ